MHGILNSKCQENVCFSLNRPTKQIRSSSCKVCPWGTCWLTLSPSHAILPGEQRRSEGSKAVSHRGLSTLGGGGLYIYIFFTCYPPLFRCHRNKNIGATIRIAWEIWLIWPCKSDGHPIFCIMQFMHVSRHFKTRSRKEKTRLIKLFW